MPAVPVSASTEAALKKLYEEKKAAGEEDDAINAATLPRRRRLLFLIRLILTGAVRIDTGSSSACSRVTEKQADRRVSVCPFGDGVDVARRRPDLLTGVGG